jgi:hypothetical protein
MGLTLDTFEFARVPPSEAELRTYLRESVGSERGLDAFRAVKASATHRDASHRTELLCMMDSLTRAYACDFLLRNGGVPVDLWTGEPKELSLPVFVERRWKEWPWWRRLAFRFRSGHA